MRLQSPPLSLYVHLPWCVRKCPYCDFNSHERRDVPEEEYLAALLADLDADLSARPEARPVETIFFGGGTPSLMSPAFYGRLLEGLDRRLALSGDIEITLEANPGTLEQDRFRGYRDAGINRLSIGVQSFDETMLQRLGRIHGPGEAVHAAESARVAGFDNFNLDLMHGLPGQSQEQALTDLRRAIALAPTHLSWYELTIEPNTAFFNDPPEQPDTDAMADTEEAGFQLLAEAGYQRYEISAFAREGKRCRHNLNYWRFGDYLALGAGAHGKLTLPEADRILRYQKTRMPDHYLDGAGSRTRQTRELAPGERPLEFFLNALRLVEGVPATLFSGHTGLSLTSLSGSLATLREQGLLSADESRLACTPTGLAHLNRVLETFSGDIIPAANEP